MNVYEIRDEMESLVDPETGDIADYDRFVELALARDEKVDNTAAWIVNLKAEEKAIAEQIDILTKRKNAVKGKSERLTRFLQAFLNGEKFKSARVSVSYRKSSKTVVDPDHKKDFIDWAKEHAPDYLTYKEPEIALTPIRKALDDGAEIPFASVVESTNMIIK